MIELINFLKSTGMIIQAYSSYNGLANTYDYGPLGALIKKNVCQELLDEFVTKDPDAYLIESAIITKKEVLAASGHLERFEDRFVECKKCKARFRIDEGQTLTKCPNDGCTELTEPRAFNLLFKTSVGALKSTSKDVYLRPETAQSIFANFNYYKTILGTQLPFSICQFGKAFRNEIMPANFLYRMLEFSQFEVERFIHHLNWEKEFAFLVNKSKAVLNKLGIKTTLLHEYYQSKNELAHYSKQTLDFTFDFPFGNNELLGIAYRQAYDLTQHQNQSKTNMEVMHNNQKYLPHVVEASFGIDRLLLALFLSWIKTEFINENESRVVLNCPYFLAPYSFTLLPLSTKLRKKTQQVYEKLINSAIKNHMMININLNSTSIGKKYRRNDQIGIPYCVTIDFETEKDDTVTIRDRNSMQQVRVKIGKVISYIRNNI